MYRLKNAISEMIEISEEEAGHFMSYCYRKSFPKKAILSDDDTFIDEVYFIEQGILRVKIIDLDGREHTTHFAIENQFIADYNAFLTRKRSRYQLEAITISTSIPEFNTFTHYHRLSGLR
jgi:CRP-like cAMP-binding protein